MDSSPLLLQSTLLFLGKKKLKEKIVSLIKTDVDFELRFDKKHVISLNLAILNLTVERNELIDCSKLPLSFEIIYDMKYIFVCHDNKELNNWVNTLSTLMTTWNTFGCSLRCAINKSGWKYPIPLYRGIEYLMKNEGWKESGIFRTNCPYTSLQKIKKHLDENQDIDLTELNDNKIAASIIKLYLNSLPESLIPPSCYKNFISISNEEGYKNFIKIMPHENLSILFYLLSFLNEIVQRVDENMMTSNNLAICVGITTSRPPQNVVVDEIQHSKDVISSFTYLIDHFEENCPEEFKDLLKEEPPLYPSVTCQQPIPIEQAIISIKNKLKQQKCKEKRKRHSVGNFFPFSKPTKSKHARGGSDTYLVTQESKSNIESPRTDERSTPTIQPHKKKFSLTKNLSFKKRVSLDQAILNYEDIENNQINENEVKQEKIVE
ncbi:Rho-GAP domain-containing protein [Entamoeba marina]